jgi:alpha-amylase
MSKKRGSVGGTAPRAVGGEAVAHPMAAGATKGRHAVRPRLRPFTRVARAVPAAPAAASPVGELYNGHPTDVMLQGFHVTSCQSRSPSWYAIVAQNAAAIAAAGFDIIWMPPPSASADELGYMPTRWQVLDSSYGARPELLAALAALRSVTPVADVVVNHRCGVATPGDDFADPAFPDQAKAVCCDDEWPGGTGNFDTGEHQAAARDLDHTNVDVQHAIEGYQAELAAVGFRGWRYDEARGYAGGFVQLYNDASRPYLSVGEFWDADRQNVMNWIDATGGRSMAFDFPTRTVLKDALARRQFGALKTVDGKPTGAIGWWPAMSVTFIENHDTDKDSAHPDEFGDGDQVLQGYAYLLTHPGIPCVFWPHFFDYGDAIRAKLAALIAIRKAQGLHRASVVNIAAADDARYAAIVDGKVAVKLGPGPWDPGDGWRVATDGNDFAVWTRG